jgi:hypothetical protein
VGSWKLEDGRQKTEEGSQKTEDGSGKTEVGSSFFITPVLEPGEQTPENKRTSAIKRIKC